MRPILPLVALAACAHAPDASSSITTPDAQPEEAAADRLRARASELDAQVDADLQRLDALQLFEVGELVGGDASEAFHCYGPCPDADAQVERYAERAEALRELVDLAEATPSESDACPEDEVDDALAAIRALQVVEVGAFVHEQAASSPYCYNLPCPEDEAMAHESNCRRAARLIQVAAGS